MNISLSKIFEEEKTCLCSGRGPVGEALDPKKLATLPSRQ
jgi:hypothetical protein